MDVSDQFVWVVRLVVAGVFALAAWGKLADPASIRAAVREFGVSARLAPAAGWALPAVELIIAIGVLVEVTAVAACVAALLLLGIFSAAVALQLRRGRHPDCSCFGGSAAPISRWTLARNTGLATLLGCALWGSVSVDGVPAGLPAEQAVGLALAVALATVQVRQAMLIRALRGDLAVVRVPPPPPPSPEPEGLPVGLPAPAFDLPAIDGGRGSLAGLLASGDPLLLVFLHPTCAPCRIVADDLADWYQGDHDGLEVMAIGSGDPAVNAAWAANHDLTRMLVQDTNEVAVRYGLRGTPTAVLVDAAGRIVAPAAGGIKAVRELLHGSTPSLART